jgi:hypothetical protein
MAVIKLSPDTYLSTDDGVIITKTQAEEIIRTTVLRQKNLTVKDNVSMVSGRDRKIVTLDLKGLNENISSTRGFLVTVYLSGTGGNLIRMYKKTIIDPASSSVMRGSFADYIDLEFDV